MGAPPPPTTRPAGCPIDSFGGHAIYPIPAPCEAFPWGVHVSLLVIPLVMTASHLLYELEGRFWIGRRAYGGIVLHAALTRDGWITANGNRYAGPPALMVAAAGVVLALLTAHNAGDEDAREWVVAANLAAAEAGIAIRGERGEADHG